MSELYPLKFKSILKEMIWGGHQIPQMLNKPYTNATCIGELYSISGLHSDCSIVQNGPLQGKKLDEIIKIYGSELMGEAVHKKFGEEFPLLIKFIDANDDLSVQVHPNDDQARAIQGRNGKTEMWYIIKSEEDSKLISGFNCPISKEVFTDSFAKGELMDLMAVHPTNTGDTFFIPAGKVHSIGKGNLIAEIQQTSDITYRIYDFDRKDANGNPRELHHEQARNVINYQDAESGKIDKGTCDENPIKLVDCEYFTTNQIDVNNQVLRSYSHIDSFVILINVGGIVELTVNSQCIVLGALESVLIPSCFDRVQLESANQSRLLEVYICS